MRHNRTRRTLGLKRDHRTALLVNLVVALVERKKIRTTVLKAKETGRFADKLITIAKKQSLAAHRQLVAETRSKDTAKVFIDILAPAFKERQGGYTRVLKADNRPGDNATMAYVEFTTDYELPGEKEKEAKKKSRDEKTAKAEKAPKAPKASKAKPAAEKASEKKAQKESGEEKPGEELEDDEKKSSGFLGNLRGFLKGD
jgi:large subunit ribosomal protein L17